MLIIHFMIAVGLGMMILLLYVLLIAVSPTNEERYLEDLEQLEYLKKYEKKRKAKTTINE